MKKVASITIIMFCFTLFFWVSSYAYTDISPVDAYDMVESEDNVYIIDVRSEAEWIYVGHPGVPG